MQLNINFKNVHYLFHTNLQKSFSVIFPSKLNSHNQESRPIFSCDQTSEHHTQTSNLSICQKQKGGNKLNSYAAGKKNRQIKDVLQVTS